MTSEVRVLLLHLDGSQPNLALMRIAAHHRALGDYVELRRADNKGSMRRALAKGFQKIEPRLGDEQWNRVYGSLIFLRTRPLAERARSLYPGIVLGGTGWNLTTTLEDVGIETEGPVDYSCYPKFTASLGFTQRGCRLECDHCVVPEKEGKVRGAQTIAEIWRGGDYPKRILLLDNDFFGNPEWPERIQELRDGDFEVSFNQGINARMLNKRSAAAIASVKYRDDGFKKPRIYTAWDGKKDERVLFRGLQALVEAGIKPDAIMVYMLIGFAAGEQHADRDYRRVKLREFGARPYPMPYVRDGHYGDELVAFQRWVVTASDKRISWEDWWGRAKGEPRKLGDRRVSLPLFTEAT